MNKQQQTSVVNMRADSYDIRIDRGTKWGNVFEIGKHGTRKQVIELYRSWILQQDYLLECLRELQGKKLGCWCKPKQCHGDVLVELADRQLIP